MIEYKGPGTYSQWKLYSDKDSHTVSSIYFSCILHISNINSEHLLIHFQRCGSWKCKNQKFLKSVGMNPIILENVRIESTRAGAQAHYNINILLFAFEWFQFHTENFIFQFFDWHFNFFLYSQQCSHIKWLKSNRRMSFTLLYVFLWINRKFLSFFGGTIIIFGILEIFFKQSPCFLSSCTRM